MSDNGCNTPECVCEAFLASPPLVGKTIYDLSLKTPNWLRDTWKLEEFPLGNGTVAEQIIFRGSRPRIERGLGLWKKVGNNSGCSPCAGPDCNYNWTDFGGHGFERKLTELMMRDFRSPKYCIHEIQTTASFKQVFAKIVENLYAQVAYFKEMNIGLNVLTMLAKKFVVDSGGAKANPADIYSYRNIGTARLSALNLTMLEFFYEQMRRMTDVVPYDVVDGQPIYALLASPQTLAHVYRDDLQARKDVRFSSLANDLVLKYNFMSTIRGQFLAAPFPWVRRFNIVAGEPVEVLPDIQNIPDEVGCFTGINEAYDAATHEEIILHGKFPFGVMYQPTATTLGENTSFGPEYSFMNTWKWVNPLTDCDPNQREGFFMTSARIGISQQFSAGIFGILVERPPRSLMFQSNPDPECPSAVVTPCTNLVPDAGCPCPVVLNIVPNPMVPGNAFVTFGVAVSGAPTDPIVFALDNGGTITGELVLLSADGLSAEVEFPAGTDLSMCSGVTSVYCIDTAGCSAKVVSTICCRSGATGVVKLLLNRAIKADTVGDDILVTFGDCTTALMDITAIDASTLTWTVQYAPGYGPTDDPTGSCETTTLGAPVLEYAEFFALMPGDNAATVAVGGAVDFPQNGPTSGTIVRAGVDTFTLPTIGTYRILSQVSVSEAGQLVIKLNATELAYTVVGRATGTSQIVVESIVTTTVINSVLSIVNPTGNATALTITPIAGGTNAASASLLIERLAPVAVSSVTAPCPTLTEDLCCDRCGVVSVCVPPATDPTCPACDVVFVPCEEEQA